MDKCNDISKNWLIKCCRIPYNCLLAMVKNIVRWLVIPGILCCGESFVVSRPASVPPPDLFLSPPSGLHIIVLDAGHGGLDPGTAGLTSHEKDVTLKITLKLGAAIKKAFPGIKIVYTRTTDIMPGNASSVKQGIYNRATIANQAKGDLFVSIHCDATVEPAGGHYEQRITGYRKKKTYTGTGRTRKTKIVDVPVYKSFWIKNTKIGATTFIWKADRSGLKGDAIDQRDQDSKDVSEGADAWDTEGPEARIRADLYEKKYFNNSARLAELIEASFAKAGRKTWGVRQRGVGIKVLEATGMPSVLIETGYLSNKEEERYLNSERGQREVVNNIISALKRYNRETTGK